MYKTTRVCRFHTNPRPDYEFKSGDVVWIAGETSSCEWLGGSKEQPMLSRKTRYAIMALSILAREWGGDNAVPMSIIARDRHVPQRFLEGIFLQLRNASLLESVRGVSGGYRLSRPPGEISILDVILALDEDVELISCLDICGRASACEFGLDRADCRIRPLFGEIQEHMHATLLHKTLADLI